MSGAVPVPPGPVLLVIDSLDGGGAERYVVDLAVALRKRGWPVEVACSVGGVRAAGLADAGIPVTALLGELVKRRVSGRYGRALRGLVQERRPAVVHAHLYASAAAAVLATRGTGVPVVLTEHTEAPWRDRAARAVSRRVYSRVDHLVAVSSAIRDTLVNGFGVPPGRVDVLLPATLAAPATTTAPARSTPAVVPTASARRRRDGTTPAGLVGVVGRLVPEKGVDVFLRAAALVTSVVPTAHFLVVGDGPLHASLQRHAAALGLTHAVTFTGFRTDAARLIADLDVLVVPSRSDGSPLVVCEAMAAGVPVVASRVGGLPDLVTDGRSGLLVRPEDPEALARALVALLLDPASTRELGTTARSIAAQRSHARLVDRMTELYTEVCSAVAQPAR